MILVEVSYPEYTLGQKLYVIEDDIYDNKTDTYLPTVVDTEVLSVTSITKSTIFKDAPPEEKSYKEYRLLNGQVLSPRNLIQFSFLNEEDAKKQLIEKLEKNVKAAEDSVEYETTYYNIMKNELERIRNL